MNLLSALFILLIQLTPPAQAEYRAFLLKITSSDGTNVEEFASTLDPLQYPTYYPLKTGEKISYTETWMCRGRTNDQPICPNPRPQNNQASVSSSAPETSATQEPTVVPAGATPEPTPAPKLNSP